MSTVATCKLGSCRSNEVRGAVVVVCLEPLDELQLGLGALLRSILVVHTGQPPLAPLSFCSLIGIHHVPRIREYHFVIKGGGRVAIRATTASVLATIVAAATTASATFSCPHGGHEITLAFLRRRLELLDELQLCTRAFLRLGARLVLSRPCLALLFPLGCSLRFRIHHIPRISKQHLVVVVRDAALLRDVPPP